MSLSRDELKQLMVSKTDGELYDILYVHAKDYTKDAIEIAREEFQSRKLDAPLIGNLNTSAEKRLQEEDTRLEWPLRIVAFFVSTMFFFIPLMLAHRHFVEQGAKRKARDWGRWALFGFVFYFTFFVLMGVLSSSK